MSPTRWLLAGTLALMVVGSLALTGGYAAYLHGPAYRRSCEIFATASLGLPTEIARVAPRGWRVMDFHDVRVWLPERRQVALRCDRARVTRTPRADDPAAYVLRLLGGAGEVSTRTWLRDDYRFVLEHGLRPVFDPTGPRRVLFSNFDLTFEREQFRLRLAEAEGQVSFENPRRGLASAACRRFNGLETDEPVRLAAVFSPHGASLRLDVVELHVPELPLAALGLAELAGLNLSTGTLAGRLEYRESDAGRSANLAGICRDVQLEEVSAPFVSPPWRGRCDELEILEFRMLNRLPQRLRLRGTVRQVRLADLLAPLGLADVGGEADLELRRLELSLDGIDRLAATVRGARLSLSAVSDALGWGRMTGDAELVVDDLTIVRNHLAALDATIRVRPAPREAPPLWIEGRLLREVVQRTIGLPLPPLLPERIEYTQAGLRLEVRDEQLYLYGTHGERERTILTVRIAGQEIALIRETETAYPLTPWLDELRARVAAQAQRHWEQLEPLTRPDSQPPAAPKSLAPAPTNPELAPGGPELAPGSPAPAPGGRSPANP